MPINNYNNSLNQVKNYFDNILNISKESSDKYQYLYDELIINYNNIVKDFNSEYNITIIKEI